MLPEAVSGLKPSPTCERGGNRRWQSLRKSALLQRRPPPSQGQNAGSNPAGATTFIAVALVTPGLRTWLSFEVGGANLETRETPPRGRGRLAAAGGLGAAFEVELRRPYDHEARLPSTFP
jgi:hypothetical protein